MSMSKRAASINPSAKPMSASPASQANSITPTISVRPATPTTLDYYGDLLTVADLSNFLGISRQTIYKEIKDGKFGRPIKFGREFRIPKVFIVEKFIQRHEI